MFSAPNTSGEELDNCLCLSPWLCSPSLVLPLHSLPLTWASIPELCGRVAPQAGPSNLPRITPHCAREGAGASAAAPPAVFPGAEGHAMVPGCLRNSQACAKGLPAPTGKTGLCRLVARRADYPGEEPPQPACCRPGSPPSFGDPPHLAQPTLLSHTHPAPDSEAPRHKLLCCRLHQPCLEKSLNPQARVSGNPLGAAGLPALPSPPLPGARPEP